jgi:hypothetical protein
MGFQVFGNPTTGHQQQNGAMISGRLRSKNLYVAMTRGSKLLVVFSKTMLLNPR